MKTETRQQLEEARKILEEAESLARMVEGALYGDGFEFDRDDTRAAVSGIGRLIEMAAGLAGDVLEAVPHEAVQQ